VTQVWSATQINGHLSGGGTTTVTYTGTAGTNSTVYAGTGVSAGKYYWEAKLTGILNNDYINGNIGFGLGNTSTSVADGQIVGIGFDSVGIFFTSSATNVDWYVNNASVSSIALGFFPANGDVFGFALDLTNNTFWFKDITQSSVWYGSASGGNPATNTSGFSLVQTSFTITAHPVVPGALLVENGDALIGYFASSAWTGTPPAGFVSFDTVPYSKWPLWAPILAQ
jgi:hypothetical protein